MSIIGSKITRGGRDWQVASTVRVPGGLRIILKATDDPECRMLVTASEGDALDSATDLARLMVHPDSRSFRDQQRLLWKVTLKAATGVGTPMGGWLVFAPQGGGQQVRILHEDALGLGTLSGDDLVKLLFRARRSSA